MRQSSSIHQQQQREHNRQLEDYKRARLYPHISDEYDYRINNRLLIAKIINPRRDKIIMDSLINASNKFTLQKKKIDVNNTSAISRSKSAIRELSIRSNRKQ